jgi:hypothetical protein
LSEEKREGTLGFFLTDLRGYDVVAGKLLATSLQGFYALIALFPILAYALCGGVTGLQVWKTSLALLNALFFSLSVNRGHILSLDNSVDGLIKSVSWHRRCESKFLVGAITSPLAVTSARTSFGMTPIDFIFSDS